MVGLDTNVLVRYLTRDNESQWEQACLGNRKRTTVFCRQYCPMRISLGFARQTLQVWHRGNSQYLGDDAALVLMREFENALRGLTSIAEDEAGKS